MNLKEMEPVIKALQAAMAEIQAVIAGREDLLTAMQNRIASMGDALGALREEFDIENAAKNSAFERLSLDFASLHEIVDDHTAKIEGRNKSAPTKRNMTDADAVAVLTGDYKEMSHKEAAEKIGLTYAQVYSARLEFTFKHVHKELRDQKWVNPWAK